LKVAHKIKNIVGLGNGHERTNRAKRNIAAGFLIRGINIGIGLLLLPITINYLNQTNYGIWITLTSLVAWFGFFDIGFGNGLRNRLAEALAKENHDLAKTYVSTTYAILIIIISLFLVAFYIANLYIKWNVVLNAGDDPVLGKELSNLAVVVFTTFGMTFVLNLITVILNADQQTAKSSMLDLVGKSLSLLLIYILTKFSNSSLLSLGLIYSSVSPLVLAIASIWFFQGKYKRYRPSFSSVDFSKAKDIFSLGAQFFIIQIAGILLYQTNNIIIIHLFGPEMVTPYNVSFKYFSVLMMGWMIVIGPFWSAITEAWTKKDIKWIKSIMNKLMLGWCILLVFGLIMLMASGTVFRFWINKDFIVPFWVSTLTLTWILINTWNGIFSQFLNGIGKIKLQMIIGIIVAIINVPLSMTFAKLIGIEGVLLSNVILGLVTVIIYPFQYSKLISFKATGIYNK
jgi:O-antigen/teichoic acid export membrane protein